MNRKSIGVVGVALVLSGFSYLIWGGIGGNLVYFVTPTELLARGEAAYDAPVRVEGNVVPGSVSWNARELDLRFHISDGQTDLEVWSKGAPPAMFQDTMSVVIEGRYNRSGIFESSNVMVRHSNEYKAPHEGNKPEDRYEALIREEGAS
jgi:cytochrome c-type biogenesis protein CcmE